MQTALAFADLPDVDTPLPKTEADDKLFRELAEVLKRHNPLDRFGITLLHTHFPIKDGETLLETSDENHFSRKIKERRHDNGGSAF